MLNAPQPQDEAAASGPGEVNPSGITLLPPTYLSSATVLPQPPHGPKEQITRPSLEKTQYAADLPAFHDLLLIYFLAKRARVHSIHKGDAYSPTPAHFYTKSKSKPQSLPSMSHLPFRQETRVATRQNL